MVSIMSSLHNYQFPKNNMDKRSLPITIFLQTLDPVILRLLSVLAKASGYASLLLSLMFLKRLCSIPPTETSYTIPTFKKQ
jgi:hypothetical protein